jgi:glycosyltransferase involved in cell wall biosynthesis
MKIYHTEKNISCLENGTNPAQIPGECNEIKKQDINAADQKIELSVVMPCLNEAQTVDTCIKKAVNFMKEHDIQGEIIIADNGSTDGSQKIASELGANVVSVEAKGYGNALKEGISEARGKYIIMGDSDDSYDFSNLMPFIEKLREGYDLVMGNRFKGGIKPGAMPPLHKYFGNPVLTTIGRIFFHCPVGDFHCGLRGFSADAAKRMDLQTTGMEFASEIAVKATLLNMKIAEVPTTLSPDGRARLPHLRSWRDGWRHLRFMLLFSPNWLFLYPGIIVMFLGAAAGMRLLWGPVSIGSVNFDVQTLLLAGTGIIIGYQSSLFAIFSRIFAITEGLLPQDSFLLKITRVIKLEIGVIAGVLLALIGTGGVVYATRYWALSSFGDLDTQVTLRFIVPSITAIIIGVQTILGSFFLSVLGLRRKTNPVPEIDE